MDITLDDISTFTAVEIVEVDGQVTKVPIGVLNLDRQQVEGLDRALSVLRGDQACFTSGSTVLQIDWPKGHPGPRREKIVGSWCSALDREDLLHIGELIFKLKQGDA